MSADQQYQYDAILKYVGDRKIFVESGSAVGETTAWAIDKFDRVITIEFAYNMYRTCLERFFDCPSVTVMNGDSADLMNLVTWNLSGPAVFWLDGHFDGGEFGLAPSGETPIVKELEYTTRRPGNVILIDDARLFGTGQYPSVSWVLNFARHHGYKGHIENDIIVLLSLR
jgi:hypothetical protein